MHSEAFYLFMADYQKNGKGQRIGQYFCNCYIKQPWPLLFYSDDNAVQLIEEWLGTHQHYNTLPTKLSEIR